MLYPLWDAGFQVGHAVTTARGAIDRAEGDIHAATSLLTARLVAGDGEVFDDLIDRRTRWLTKARKPLVRRIITAVRERHGRVERAGWVLSPDIKEDVGALRDIHALQWLSIVTGVSGVSEEVAASESLLLAVREALHAELRRKSDKVRSDLQPAVAARLGITGEGAADLLMARVHAAARRIELETDIGLEAASENALGGPRRSGSSGSVSPGIRLEDGVLIVAAPAESSGAKIALRLLRAHADSGRPIARRALGWLQKVFEGTEQIAWDEDLRAEFLGILRGPHSVSALELLDHIRAWDRLIPQWKRVRGQIQHDPWHRYTVDGHSFVAVAEIARVLEDDPLARTAADEAGDLDALYLGALLHDIGKGSAEDHSVAGERLARDIASLLGLDSSTTEDVASLVRLHLLLPDTATRRDLDDGAVIASVASRVDARRLRMLFILSAADGRATGPESWTPWKEALVAELYLKALAALEEGTLPTRSDVAVRLRELEAYEPLIAAQAESLLESLPPSYLSSTSTPEMADELRLMLRPLGPGQINCHVLPEGNGQAVVTICLKDRPGALARAAGVMALHRLSILRAQGYSTETGIALQRFVVATPETVDWTRFEHDLGATFSGRLALEARLEKKVGDYRPTLEIEPEIRILQQESDHSTVVEVRAGDTLGLLYAVTAGLGDLETDIHVAKIDTRGDHVVDVFYVRSLEGTKLDEVQAAEVERAIRHRIARLLG
jgi:[protein-PII] uridylyltransferase